MSKQGTVTINGRGYDAVTGLPVAAHSAADAPTPAESTPQRTPSTATHLHANVQRSTTLSRKFTKKPTPQRVTVVPHQVKTSLRHDIKPATSPQIRRFAPHPVGAAHKMADIAPATVHPHVAKAHARSAMRATGKPAQTAHASAQTVKNQAITQALANTQKATKPHKTSFWQLRQRVVGIVAATFAIVLLGGYFTYLNMPSLSVRVAAAQAGIDATYPNYRPDGYALNGPVTYSDGRVSMNFKANASNAAFTVNQSKSSWNSDAVLDNYVTPRAGSSYMPYTERGLTIYTYGNNAAWVNGGILYTIEGDAPLSSEQIRRIATSLL